MPKLVLTRSYFGKILDRVDTEHRSLVSEKQGAPQAVLLSIRDYVRLAAPEPEVLRIVGADSQRKGTDKLTDSQIDRIIRKVRTERRVHNAPHLLG
jgi:PHD/YefM family antitoxin component YafN of YafNO toxin-antitoxin module